MATIIFEIETEHGLYCDALNLPDDHNFTDIEIEAMKQDRVNNWLSIISAAIISSEDEVL
jgi:hypothetical protein